MIDFIIITLESEEKTLISYFFIFYQKSCLMLTAKVEKKPENPALKFGKWGSDAEFIIDPAEIGLGVFCQDRGEFPDKGVICEIGKDHR